MLLLLTKTGCFQSARHARTFAWLDIPMGWEWPWCLWRAQSRDLFSTMMGVIKLDMWGFMADVNVTVWTPKCGEQIEATSSPEKIPCRLVGREHYRKLSTKPSCSCSQNVSSMCFYNLKQWLEFQCVPPTQNSCHSLRKSDCRFDVKLIIIFSMRHSLSSL